MSVELLNICVMATLSISSFLIVWLRYAAGGMSVTQPGMNSHPLNWKCRILTTGPPGISPQYSFFMEESHWMLSLSSVTPELSHLANIFKELAP